VLLSDIRIMERGQSFTKRDDWWKQWWCMAKTLISFLSLLHVIFTHSPCLSMPNVFSKYPVALDTILCDKVCQWLAAGRWFSPGTPVSSTNKTDRHDITEILWHHI
jgi:hypothetical protein